jgi:GNAT superfamily N-acetyltransferase
MKCHLKPPSVPGWKTTAPLISRSCLPFLALRGASPIGMAWLALVDRDPGPRYFTRRSAYVQSVFVVSHERTNGVATTLMGILLTHSRTLGLDYVAVHPSERSFSLYRRLGFTETDRCQPCPGTAGVT